MTWNHGFFSYTNATKTMKNDTINRSLILAWSEYQFEYSDSDDSSQSAPIPMGPCLVSPFHIRLIPLFSHLCIRRSRMAERLGSRKFKDYGMLNEGEVGLKSANKRRAQLFFPSHVSNCCTENRKGSPGLCFSLPTYAAKSK